MVERLPLTVESLNKMKEIDLQQDQMLEFAKRALETRFNIEKMGEMQFNLEALLNPTRLEDEGKDLWSVFNIVQEKIIDGDFIYNVNGKTRKARRIKNFIQDQKINKELFELALEYVN
jgi:hypothetical protein